MENQSNEDIKSILTVDECTEKWAPLVVGLSDQTQRRLAWVLEQETVRLLANCDASAADECTKYVFPVARLIVEALAEVGSEADDVTAELVEKQVDLVISKDAPGSPPVGVPADFCKTLATSLQGSMLSFPG